MSTEAQPPAAQAPADQPQQEKPKRLPFLWLLCVLLCLGGMFCLTAIFEMKPFGMLIFGGFTVLCFGLATALWLRLRAGWYAAMAVLALTLAWAVVSDALKGEISSLTIALGWAPPVVVALYLYLRRPHFGREGVPRPRVLSAPGIGALAVVLLIGGGFLAFMTVDDPRQSFPALEVQLPTSPAQENGFLLMEQMNKKWPLDDDEQLVKLVEGLPTAGAEPGPEWLKEARPIVQKYRDCLAEAPQLIKMPHFVDVPRCHGMHWAGEPMPWVDFARRLAQLQVASAEVDAADGRWSAALDEADNAIKLGRLLGKESTRPIPHVVAIADVDIGTIGLRNVAARVPDAALLREHLGPLLPEAEFIRGFNTSMAGEFQGNAEVMEALRHGGMEGLAAITGTEINGFWARQFRLTPFMHRNITYNALGRALQPNIIRNDTYKPVRPNVFTEGVSPFVLIRSLGFLRFTRNAAGYMAVEMLAPAFGRANVDCFQVIALARLTQVFIALRCCQLEHGKLPTSLDALVPAYLKALPVDPFTGRLFHYEPTGEKPRIWSVGPNGHTDKQYGQGGDDEVVAITFAQKEAH